MMTIEYNAHDIDRHLNALSRAFGVSVQKLCWDQMSLYAMGMMKGTAPMRTSVGHIVDSGQRRLGSMMGARKVGQRRVAIDINKILLGMDSGEVATAREMGGQIVNKTRFVNKAGAIWLVDAEIWKPDASMAQIKKFHDRTRGAKTGRVSTAKGKGESSAGDKRIGRWKASRQMHVKKSTKDAYIKEKQRHVGKLKDGWTAGAVQWGEKAGKSVRVPAWIRRAGGRGNIFGFVNSSGSGSIGASNQVPYAQNSIRESLVAFEGRKRQRDLIKHVEKRIDKLVVGFNK